MYVRHKDLKHMIAGAIFLFWVTVQEALRPMYVRHKDLKHMIADTKTKGKSRSRKVSLLRECAHSLAVPGGRHTKQQQP